MSHVARVEVTRPPQWEPVVAFQCGAIRVSVCSLGPAATADQFTALMNAPGHRHGPTVTGQGPSAADAVADLAGGYDLLVSGLGALDAARSELLRPEGE